MDITQWYAVALAGLVALFIIVRRLLGVIAVVWAQSFYYLLKHLVYPSIHHRISTTRFELLLIVTFLAGNIVSISVGITNISELIARSAKLFTVNLMPLSLGAHMNLIVNDYGISLPNYTRMHRWLGRVAIAEAIVHVVAAALSTKIDLRTPKDVAAVMASIAIAIMLVLSFANVQRYAYEFFSKFHVIIVVVLIASTYIHIAPKKLFTPPAAYLFAAVCTYILISVLRLSLVLFRSYRTTFTRAAIRTLTYKTRDGRHIPIVDAVHVHVQLPRPWKPQTAQWLYLSLPGISNTSFAQSHPFYVSSWYRDDNGHDIAVLIVQKRKGFTKNLLMHTTNGLEPDGERIALIEGPYGRQLDLDSYQVVLLFATGIGIAAQLPYVRTLVESHYNYKRKGRKIMLFWEIDSELHTAWLGDMMFDLFQKDLDKILDIQIFVRRIFFSQRTPGDVVTLGKRIDVNYLRMNAEDLIRTQCGIRRGSTVVSVCTDDDTRNNIRAAVCSMKDRDVCLKELDFRPFWPYREKGTWNLLDRRSKDIGRSAQRSVG